MRAWHQKHKLDVGTVTCFLIWATLSVVVIGFHSGFVDTPLLWIVYIGSFLGFGACHVTRIFKYTLQSNVARWQLLRKMAYSSLSYAGFLLMGLAVNRGRAWIMIGLSIMIFGIVLAVLDSRNRKRNRDDRPPTT